MLKTKQVTLVEVHDWDELVEDTYGRPYAFQQQSGCQPRGVYHLTVPCEADDFEDDAIPEDVNTDEMGVSFKAWLERDPQQPIADDSWSLELWWKRNFYPAIEAVANDLHERGMLPAGEYTINIDW